MKVVTVVGARPQFVKVAAIVRAFERTAAGTEIEHRLIHTGQHYDHDMSAVFFQELGIPSPVVNLGLGGGTHGEMTGRMLIEIEKLLMASPPDWVLVYGDTDSTLAGALAGAKLHLPVGHIEAGLRSFNRGMPEEINRIVVDHVSDLLLCPTPAAMANLAREGLGDRAELVGDVMCDATLYHQRRLSAAVLAELDLVPGSYFLATCHRAENVDNVERLGAILAGLARVATLAPVVFPVHPRTERRLEELNLKLPSGVRLVSPLGYLLMLALEANAIAVLTDSGGVQKEAYILGVPCVTMRDETEWIETIETGWNVLAGTDADRIFEAAAGADDVRRLPRPSLFGDGHAAERITAALIARSR